MDDLGKLVVELEEKVAFFEHHFEQLRREKQELEVKLQLTREANARLQSENKDQLAKMDVLQVAQTLQATEGDNERREELKNNINRYIREIDQCLKLLSD